MPAIKRTFGTAGENVLEGLKFSVLNAPALVSLYASTATEGETLSMSVGDRDIVVDAVINTESASQVVDTDRDAILVQEPVPAGKLYLSIPTITADVGVLLLIEPVA